LLVGIYRKEKKRLQSLTQEKYGLNVSRVEGGKKRGRKNVERRREA
jgi:hypothetical protein